MELRALSQLVSHSPGATQRMGALLGTLAPSGLLVALNGDLGSGKTCFVRGVAEGLGLVGGIQSPTYTLMQTHEGGRLSLHHFDAWMEGRQKALLGDGGLETWHGDGLCIVEWADRLAAWLPDPHVEIRLGHMGPQAGDGQRRMLIGIRGSGDLLRGPYWGWMQELQSATAGVAGIEIAPREGLEGPWAAGFALKSAWESPGKKPNLG